MFMKSPTARANLAAALFAYLLLALSSAAWAGGEAGEDDHDHDDGPNYFGFVKDTSGKTIRDAKVTADIKGRPSIVARTNAAGAYRIPGFGKDIPPSNVTISCVKEVTNKPGHCSRHAQAKPRPRPSRSNAPCSGSARSSFTTRSDAALKLRHASVAIRHSCAGVP